MSSPNTNILPTQGINLLRSLLNDPHISPQKQPQKIIETLGSRPVPTYGNWTIAPNQNNFHQSQNSQPTFVPVRRYFVYKYHYEYYDPIPLHHLFNTSMKNQNEIDEDAFLPQSDLYWMRKRQERYEFHKNQKEKH
ncbi:hypothetical protein CRE_28525 [Caenorhabditis remanei]|uniref:Uncharacterized protein n=1 Tax=Caenorhabditis remanei TaxID=31234 RepID=E3LMY7_CAERE|nr:hypothetical protein CRE_28525 [Caenorhabditis remanei]